LVYYPDKTSGLLGKELFEKVNELLGKELSEKLNDCQPL
jgi:hypothetical protein